MMKHRLKVWPEYFEPLVAGEKKFEIRVNDRCFEVGDMLVLREFDQETEKYTGRAVFADVTYILSGAPFLPDDKVILSLGEVYGYSGGLPDDEM